MNKIKSTFFLLFFCYVAVAQNEVSSAHLSHLNDGNLRNVQALLLKWQIIEINLDPQDQFPWEQSISVDEKTKQIIYRFRDPYNGGETEWWQTHYIPILSIDSITSDFTKNTITFFTPHAKIYTRQLDYPDAKNEKVVMYMQLEKVRNLVGQLWGYIREYQLKWKNRN